MMKRLIYKVLAGLIAFVIGWSLTSTLNASRAISLCEVDAHHSRYGGKTVRVRAIFERSENYISASSVCSNGEFPGAGIELDPGEAAKFPLPLSGEEPSGIYLMDAVIVGQLDTHVGPGCFGPKYRLLNVRVEKVFTIKKFEDMPQAIEWMKSNSY